MSHCFLLLRTFCTNIYRFANYWTRVCPATHRHCVYREGERLVYVRTLLYNSLLFAICVRLNPASKHMLCEQHPWETELLVFANVCCPRTVWGVSDGREAVGNGTFIIWTLTWTSGQGDNVFPESTLKDHSLHVNSICNNPMICLSLKLGFTSTKLGPAG